MDQRTRNLMTMRKALHAREVTLINYVSVKDVRRGHTRIEDSIDVST